MALTGKQIRQLRGLAHHLNPIVNIGKSDISDNLIKQTDESLEAHELVKCAVQDGSNLTAQEAASLLSEAVNADIVQIIGRRFTLYRASSRKDIEKIKLV